MYQLFAQTPLYSKNRKNKNLETKIFESLHKSEKRIHSTYLPPTYSVEKFPLILKRVV